MKLAIIGYGKMGHAIERIARERGNEIVAIIDVNNPEDFDSEAYASADCAIEFTSPTSAEGNILRSFAAGVPVVCGSTGWLSALPAVEKACKEYDSAFMHSSNFSVGVNIFKAMNRWLSAVMERFPEYKPSMVEVHHIHKLDHPSGTAITLAEEIGKVNSYISGWHEPEGKSFTFPGKEGESMEIAHRREGEVPGIHTITWNSPVDEISVTHSAHSRDGFALGAVMAAEWLAGKKGVYSIDEMFNF